MDSLLIDLDRERTVGAKVTLIHFGLGAAGGPPPGGCGDTACG
jgi:hypothetical protein